MIAELTDRVDVIDGCWIWQGATQTEGYGMVSVRGIKMLAHRWAWQLAGNEVVEQLHHDCGQRRCVNPEHLIATTAHQHRRQFHRRYRATECASGHPYDGDNLYISPAGTRRCRACNRRNATAYRARRAMAR